MLSTWYEVRVDGEKVAAFAPSETQGSLEESLEEAHKLVDTTRFDLYKDKVMQIVEIKNRTLEDIHDDLNRLKVEQYPTPYTLSNNVETVVHEEHPTVFEDEDENLGTLPPLKNK